MNLETGSTIRGWMFSSDYYYYYYEENLIGYVNKLL